MNETISKIRTLLDELEATAKVSEDAVVIKAFSGTELPGIICDVVDLLMPNLKPLEMSLYLWLVRRSILENGSPYLRVGLRGLQGVVRPHRDYKASDSDNGLSSNSPEGPAINYKTVREALKGLETIGAIRREGATNNDGTLYRVLMPEEIEACQKLRERFQSTAEAIEVQAHEVDYYNVRENRMKVYERDGYKCKYCDKQLTRFTVTLDHVKPVSEGGDNSFNNLVTACLECNSKKNARDVGDFMVGIKRAF